MKEIAAHEAFRNRNFITLANSLLEKAEFASEMYKIDGNEKWDMRVYGAYNAAGGIFEMLGKYTTSTYCYSLALSSCERVATGRGPEWQTNIDHLNYLIERVNKK